MTRFLLIMMVFHAFSAWGESPSKSSAPAGPNSFGLPATLYLDAYVYAGATTGNVEGHGGSVSLNQEGVGITVGPMINSFFLALGTDYRQVNNSKTPDSQIGSFRGTRWAPLVITAGYVADTVIFKVDYEPTGTFRLSQPTYQGGSVSYAGGGGYRITAMYRIGGGFLLGPQYESLKFSSRYDSNLGESTGQGLTLSQIGLTGTFVF